MLKPLAILFTFLFTLAGFATAHAAQSTFQPPEDIPEGLGGKTTLGLYALIDLNVQYVSSGSLSSGAQPNGGGTLWRLADGTAYGPGSRLGFRINQDLTSGWDAGALLEMGYNANNQTLAQGGRIFGRQGFAYLKSDEFGEFRFGRQYMLHDDSINSTNPTGGTTVLAPGAITNVKGGFTFLFIDASRIDDAFQYCWPKNALPYTEGFQVKAMVALSQKVQDRYEGVKAAYNKGPFGVEVVYEQSKAFAPVNNQSTVNKVLEIGANYDFGVFKLFSGYQRGKDLTTGIGTQVGTWALPGLDSPATNLKAYNIGASTQVGKAVLMANYTHSVYTSASGASVNISRYGPGVIYFWTKQTAFYGAIGISGGGLKDFVSEKVLAQVGFRKFF